MTGSTVICTCSRYHYVCGIGEIFPGSTLADVSKFVENLFDFDGFLPVYFVYTLPTANCDNIHDLFCG